MKSKITLLGGKLGHSLSPLIHSFLGDYEYTLTPVGPDGLDLFFFQKKYTGFNVTVPYKTEAFKRCDVLSGRALKIGSVNTCVYLPDGRLFGDNTDYYGFRYLLERSGCDPEGKKLVIFGSGGSEKAVRAAAGDMGAAEIITVSRTGENNYSNLYRHYDADIVVNTTPVGMFPEPGKAAADISGFEKCEFVFDLIYNPFRTKLLIDAEKAGKKAVNGLPMLVAQAKLAAEIFTGEKLDEGCIEDITGKIRLMTSNIVFIGMPGAGKSENGKKAALKTGRDFYDTDKIIEGKFGRPVAEIFAQEGEERFRQAETEVLGELRNVRGAVIATGGGLVEREENRDLMRENSIVIYLDVPAERLELEGRPLSMKYGVKELYERRKGIYESLADFTVKGDIDKNITFERVMKCISL